MRYTKTLFALFIVSLTLCHHILAQQSLDIQTVIGADSIVSVWDTPLNGGFATLKALELARPVSSSMNESESPRRYQFEVYDSLASCVNQSAISYDSSQLPPNRFFYNQFNNTLIALDQDAYALSIFDLTQKRFTSKKLVLPKFQQVQLQFKGADILLYDQSPTIRSQLWLVSNNNLVKLFLTKTNERDQHPKLLRTGGGVQQFQTKAIFSKGDSLLVFWHKTISDSLFVSLFDKHNQLVRVVGAQTGVALTDHILTSSKGGKILSTACFADSTSIYQVQPQTASLGSRQSFYTGCHSSRLLIEQDNYFASLTLLRTKRNVQLKWIKPSEDRILIDNLSGSTRIFAGNATTIDAVIWSGQSVWIVVQDKVTKFELPQKHDRSTFKSVTKELILTSSGQLIIPMRQQFIMKGSKGTAPKLTERKCLLVLKAKRPGF